MYRLLLYLVAGWSGFFVMALELLGGRLLAPYFGSSIYVWGAIITVFMLALSIGYLLVATTRAPIRACAGSACCCGSRPRARRPSCFLALACSMRCHCA